MSVHYEDYTRHSRFRIGGYPYNFTFVICSVRSRGSAEKGLSTEKIYSRIETQYALTFVRPVLRLAWGHRFDQNLESLSSHISTTSLPAIPQLPLIDSSGPISALCLARRSLLHTPRALLLLPRQRRRSTRPPHREPRPAAGRHYTEVQGRRRAHDADVQLHAGEHVRKLGGGEKGERRRRADGQRPSCQALQLIAEG